MNKNDPGNARWNICSAGSGFMRQSTPAAHMVVCNGHVPSGGLMHEGKPLLDFHAFPLRIKEAPDRPQGGQFCRPVHR